MGRMDVLCVFIGLLVCFSAAEDLVGQKTDVVCRFGHWMCKTDNKCIPLSWICDSDGDCSDNSDEENCPSRTCSEQEFSCQSTRQCVPERWKCDGEPDCDNKEDEWRCESQAVCREGQFTCADKSCINKGWACDGVDDCADGSDERNCTKSCEKDMFQCKDGSCIAKSWICDGDHDCLDQSDEKDCGGIVCGKGEIKCDDSSRCIDIKWKCDGDFDCADHSDETSNCTYTDVDDPETCRPDTEFKCVGSGECIHLSWKCDGDADCTDSSDEAGTCIYTCTNDQFMCANNHTCISKSLLCDGSDDCLDGSDERNCSHKKNCDEFDAFDCYGDGSFCIPLSKVCDGRSDCEHREDENSEICKHPNPCLHFDCLQYSHCVKKAYPNNTVLAKCECDRGYEWIQDDPSQPGLCKDIDECDEPGACSQVCINTRSGYKCECHEGYTLEKHYYCRANGEQAWLYYANSHDIRKLRVDSKYTDIIVEQTTNSIALDVDYEEGFMFWTDGGTEKIMRAKVGGVASLATDITEVISYVRGEPSSSDGLAVDWLYKKIYWTDAGSDKIRVANYDGDKFKTLISTGLDDPRAICVDPENGYMYWTDWGQQPKIERSGMDGQNREIIVHSSDLQWPNGLTIDYVGRRIYWIDSKLHKIGTANLDGSDKGHVLVDAMEIKRPFSITVFEDFLYWTDWHLNSIRSVHKITGRNAKTLSLGSYSVMDIKVYHEMRQVTDFKEQAKELCSKAQCEYMCLPAAKVGRNATVSCVCADNKQLKSDMISCEASSVTVKPTITPPVTTNAPVTQTPAETTQPTTEEENQNPCLHFKCTHNSHCVKKAYPNNTVWAKCECDRGYEWIQEDPSQPGLCKDIDECDEPGACSQVCINTRGGYKCECHEGYTLDKQFYCRANGEQAWLYYANRHDIRRLRVDSKYTDIIVEQTPNSVVLDVDCEEGFLFWTDGGTEKIMRAKVGGVASLATDITEVISNVRGEPSSSDGLAVDWLYKKIYWTDAGSDKIRVANYSGDKSKTLISTGLDDPRAICVDPENGYMYWTDWGQQPKIERSGMDGQNREIIVHGGDDLQWPNGLTIDYVGRRIYWIDSKLHKIGTANLDGSDKGHVLVDAMEIKRPFSITVFEDFLYWTDWHTNSIRSVHKITGRNAKTLSLGSYSVMDIKVYHEMRQVADFKGQAKELCRKAQCEFMCLPAAKVGRNATVSCVCADNHQLKSDMRSCEASSVTAKPTATPRVTTNPLCAQTPVETKQPTIKGSDRNTQELMSKGDEVVYSFTSLVMSVLITIQLSI